MAFMGKVKPEMNLKVMGSHRSKRYEAFQRSWTLTIGDMGRETRLVKMGGNNEFNVIWLKVL